MRNLFLSVMTCLCLVGNLTAQIPNYVPTNGLVGWWPFNGNANDESGNGNNGVVNGATLEVDRFGNSNSAYQFNGTNNYIVSGFAPFTAPPFTISAWVKVNTFIGTNSPIVSIGEIGGNSLKRLYFAPSYGQQGRPTIGTGGANDITSTSNSVSLNSWTHVVVTCSSYSVGGTIFYVNGVAYSLNTTGGTNVPVPMNNSPFTFGRHSVNSGVDWFNGILDDVSMYNRVLSPQEIASLNLSVAQPQCTSLPSNLTNGLVGYWPFCGNANDESGNGNNGTVSGATLSMDRFGNANKAYSFDGINDYISNIFSMTSSDSMTIGLWYKSPVPSNISSTHFELWESGNTTNQIHLNFSFNPVPTGFMYTFITGIGQANDAVGTRSYNVWHHVVIVKAGNIETVYVDNELNFGQFVGTNSSFQFDKFELGREFTTGGNLNDTYYIGSLDDIGIWNRALTQSEISQLYTGDTVPPCASLPSNLTLGLVGYWPFCGNANDESGNGNNGTVNGATLSTDRFGNANKSYLFNGSTDYIALPSGNLTSLNITGDYTISFWIKASDNSCLLTSLGDNVSSPPNAQGYLTGINGGNVGVGKMGAATRGSWNGTNTNTLADNNWHHIVALLKADTLKFFIDNVMDNQIAGVLPPLSWNGNRVLGCRHDLFMTTATNFGGILDDIAIYNRALDTCDIDSLFNSPNPMIGAFTSACDTLYNSTSNITWYGQTVKTNDGNIVSVGTENHIYNWSNGDIFLNKYDTAFNLIWTKKFYIGGGMDVASGVLATSDGGYLIHSSFGNSNPAGNYSAGYIIKTDALGNQQWVQTLTGQSYGDNYGVQAVENSNGEFICYGHVQHHAGCSSYSTRITKLSSSGAIVWSYCIQLNPDKSGGITKLAASNIYISAFNNSSNGTIELRKWNDAGNQIGLNTYQYSNSQFSVGAVKSCQTGGYFVYGQYNSTGNQKNAFIAKFDDSMNLLWETSDNTYDENLFSTMTEDNQGNIFCASRINNFSQQGDLAVTFFNNNGVYQNKGIFNGPSTDDYIQGIVTLPNGDIICSGRSASEGILIKFCGLGPNFNPQCSSLPSNLVNGLVGYWPFCGNANDESGNGNNGVVNGVTLVADRFGNANKAYSFNGATQVGSNNTIVVVDNGIDIPNFSVNFSNNITISIWANVSNTNNGDFLNRRTDNNIDFVCSGGGNNINCHFGNIGPFAGSTNLPFNSWHHYVYVYNGSSMKLYVDGVLDNQTAASGFISNNTTTLRLGKYIYHGGLTHYFFYNGYLDDIGIWNRALTPEEIVELYSGPSTCTTPYFSDLDNDGYGGLLLGNFCSAPPNGVLQGGDCDDANSSIHPGVNEICNGVDDDCDGIVDNGSVPAIGPILGNYQSCIPLAAGTRTFSVVPIAGVNNYAWSLPVGMNLVSGQGTPTINVSWTSSTAHTGILGNLSVVPSMDCFTGNAVSVVADLNISVPVTPPSISGASRVCVGDVITYSISSVARARQYNWTLPTGMTLLSGQGSNVISAIVDSSFTGGLLNVSGVNTCGGSPLRSKTISYNIPNTPAVIVGQTQGICDLSSVIFTTAGSVGSLGYNWIVPTGITILNGQGSNTIEVSVSNSFTNGILRVVATNNCGISNQRTISLSGMPGIPSLISGPINICPGSTNNAYSVQTATGATYYTWTVPASATITSGSSTKNILVDYSSAIFSNQSITVRAGNLCGESPIRNLTGISGNISFCNRVSNGNDKSELSIYPNPANQILYLSAKGDIPQNIEIYNLLGVRVKNQESGNEVILKDLVEGVYVLKAIINQKVVVSRFEVVR